MLSQFASRVSLNPLLGTFRAPTLLTNLAGPFEYLAAVQLSYAFGTLVLFSRALVLTFKKLNLPSTPTTRHGNHILTADNWIGIHHCSLSRSLALLLFSSSFSRCLISFSLCLSKVILFCLSLCFMYRLPSQLSAILHIPIPLTTFIAHTLSSKSSKKHAQKISLTKNKKVEVG